MNVEKMRTQHDDFENQPQKNREILELNEAAESKNRDTEIIKPDIQYIETTSPKALFEQNRSLEVKSLSNSDGKCETNEGEQRGLTEDEKAKIREAHLDWSDEIIDAIGSWNEYEIYDKANLKVEYINDKPCLIRTDIDIDQKDEDGITNRQRMERGLAPINKNGEKIELHHIGQHADSPLAELTTNEHRQGGNDIILHDKSKETEVHGEGNTWDKERQGHWKTRVNDN